MGTLSRDPWTIGTPLLFYVPFIGEGTHYQPMPCIPGRLQTAGLHVVPSGYARWPAKLTRDA
jgi:hypothetical protein